MELNWKNCDCCNVIFSRKRDYEKHIKTAKHIKKSTGITSCSCPYCNYLTDDKSNLNKHIKTVHREQKQQVEENVIKVGDTNIPEAILKQYFMLKSSVNNAYYAMMGKKHRIKMLKNRLFKDDEVEVIEAKKEFKASIEFYNTVVKSLKDLEDKYPEIIKANEPKINDNGEAEEDSDDDDDVESEEHKKRCEKLLELDDMKDELQELYDRLKDRDYSNLQKHKIDIKRKENEIKVFMKELYKKN